MRRLYLIVSLLIMSTLMYAQREGELLPELQAAKRLMPSDPQRAIQLIQKQLKKNPKRSNVLLRSQAYELLGDVYMSIDQQQLGLDRYQRAEKMSDSKLHNYRLKLKIGRAQSFFSDVDAAATFEEVANNSLVLREQNQALEGLADIDRKNEKYTQALSNLQSLEKNYSQLNSATDLVRIQSKIAQVYAAMNQDEYVRSNVENAYSNMQRAPKAKRQDVEAYDQAVTQLISQERNTMQEINLRSQNVLMDNAGAEYQAVERLKLADAYVRNSEVAKAISTLELAEVSLKDVDAPEIKADINKKKSEAFVLQGQWQKAMDALSDYELQQSLAIESKQQELDRQIEIVKSQQAIDLDEKELINTANKLAYERDMTKTQGYIILLLALLLLGALISLVLIWRNIRAKNKANLQLHLKGLRSQMNPHFIFNALNTVNEYIVTQDERKANQYLADFSALMRRVLENSQKDLITLTEEVEMTKLYIELEHRRFADKFDYRIDVPDYFPEEIMVPPLLFQPYIENAIWHGLRYREDQGLLSFQLKEEAGSIHVIIEDNGIGRANSMTRKTTNQKIHKSTGLRNTGKRLELIKQLYQRSIDLTIVDAVPSDAMTPGTRVSLTISG